MKNLFFFITLIFYSTIGHAGGGIYEYYININGSWYGNVGNPTLHNASLATNLNLNTDVLNIGTRGINTWNDGGCDVSSANMNYRVYKQGNPAPTFLPISLSYQGMSGNNKFWNNPSPQINLLAGLTEEGTYVFEVYFDAPTNGQGGCDPVLYENNGGGNFIATFTVATPLPVKYGSINVLDLGNNQNKIYWTTFNEINNDYFEVQHSMDGIDFEVIGMVTGNGNSNKEIDYAFIHKNPYQSLDYYRLKQVDYDGKHEFSPIVSLSKKSTGNVHIFPNPTQGVLNFNGIQEETKVTIYDWSGKVIRNYENFANSFIDIQDIEAGMYIISVINNDAAQSFKIVKE